MKPKRKPLKKGLLYFALLIALVLILRIAAGLLLKEVKVVVSQEEEALRAHSLKLHHDAIMIDAHNEVATWIHDFGFDLGMDGGEQDDRSAFFYHLASPFCWLPNPPHGENVSTHTDFGRMRQGGLDAAFFFFAVEDMYYESEVPGQSNNAKGKKYLIRITKSCIKGAMQDILDL